MARYRILPYRQGSKSARALADALGGKVLKLQGSKYKPRQGDVIVNWGNTAFNEDAEWGAKTPDSFFNYDTDLMKFATNKLNFFKCMAEENADIIPQFWTRKEDIPDDKFPIVCRKVLAGHSGGGIVIADVRDDLVDAPLYVEYKKKKDEYRVHVGFKQGQPQVIAVQRKARRLGVPDEEVNWKVRNLANGFVFVREGVVAPDCVVDAARRALQATGLDFGGVDVGYNEHEGKATVYEINTACGLEGQTVEDYANFFRGA